MKKIYIPLILLLGFILYPRVMKFKHREAMKIAHFKYADGQPEEAKTYAQKYLKYHPDFSLGWSFYGKIHLSLKDTLNAERYFKKALELDTENKQALTDLGKIEERRIWSDSQLIE